MDSSNLPQVGTAEKSPVTNLPGDYAMDGVKQHIITAPGDEGAVQADALVRVGFKRVGELPSRVELLAMQKKQLVKDLADEKRAKADEEAELASLVEAELEATAPAPEVKAPEAPVKK